MSLTNKVILNFQNLKKHCHENFFRVLHKKNIFQFLSHDVFYIL